MKGWLERWDRLCACLVVLVHVVHSWQIAYCPRQIHQNSVTTRAVAYLGFSASGQQKQSNEVHPARFFGGEGRMESECKMTSCIPCCHGLSGRPIFFNFVTFSIKHGSTADKAYSRLLGSRYVHANAHRRP